MGTNRTACGIIAIVLGLLGLGGFGIHKFVMGQTSNGILWILITVLTCGVGGAILTVLSIAEGIIYLTKTDHQFYIDYDVNKKAWF